MPELDLNSFTEQDVCNYIRRMHSRWKVAMKEPSKKTMETLGAYIGGELMWRPGEVANRITNKQPWVSINRIRPAVDQVVNQQEETDTGPEASYVGADDGSGSPDIVEGLIRDYEWRSDANGCRSKALFYGVAGGQGLYVMETEYVNERSMEQQIVLKRVDDPSSYFSDISATAIGRSDARYGGQLLKYSREELINEFGPDLKILNSSYVSKMGREDGGFLGWIKDQFNNDSSDEESEQQESKNEWTGAGQKRGPFYVCKFYHKNVTFVDSTMYTDGVMRKGEEQDKLPKGVRVQTDKTGKPISRKVPEAQMWLYNVTACDVISKTRWYGPRVPHYWILGPVVWMDKKLYILSLADGAVDSNRMVNYAATSIAEMLGDVTKAPWVGPVGTFNIANAQGINPWDTVNTKRWGRIEYKPIFAEDKNGGQHLLPPPERTMQEAPVGRLVDVINFFVEQIKGATAVFFDPSLASAKQAQSGQAIRALQEQTNMGTSGWQKMLRMVQVIEYSDATKIFKKLYDGTRVRNIVRADNQHELTTINQEFSQEQQDAAKKSGDKLNANSIFGDYILRVKAGPDSETRNKEAVQKLLDAFKIAPQMLANPQAQATFIKLLGDGNPIVDMLAQLISPDPDTTDPRMVGMQNTQLKQVVQQQGQVIQMLQEYLKTDKLKLDSAERQTLLKVLGQLAVAEVTASKDADKQTADLYAQHIESVTGMAHEHAMQSEQQDHEESMGQQQIMGQQMQTETQGDQALEQQKAAASQEGGE